MAERDNVNRPVYEGKQSYDAVSCGTLHGFIHYTDHTAGQIDGAPANGTTQIIDQGETIGSNENCEDVEV